jgi:exosortase family protein XrtM
MGGGQTRREVLWLRRDRTPAPPRTLATFPLLFLALFFAFQSLYQSGRDSRVARIAIDDLTVAPSARLLSWLTPADGVVAQGHRLISSRVRLSVLNGCEGTDVMLMLAAAMLAFPMRWRRKLLGILAGGVLVYVVNQARIVALYYALRVDRLFFEVFHGYIAPILVVAVAGWFFVYWVSDAEPRHVA